MNHKQAITDNTRALDELAGALRPVDCNGFVPDDDDEPVCAECEAQDAVIAFARNILPVLVDAQARIRELLDRAGVDAA